MNRERPVLTSVCEEALLHLLRLKTATQAGPIVALPNRLLVVKVHGMGDAVMVRSLIEYYRRRHPQTEIGVMVGPATREVLTLGCDFAVHEYSQEQLNASAIVRTWTTVRRRRYDGLINFEQGSVAGTAFLRTTGIPVRVGFLPIAVSSKQALLTHPVLFREEESMWRSFIRLVQVIDPSFPDSINTLPLPIAGKVGAAVSNWIGNRLDSRVTRLAALHLGSAGKRSYRRWPVRQFVALAERLRILIPGIVVVLTGQRFESQLIDEFLASYSGTSIDATSLTSIAQTAALLARCEFLVSNDTGVMHLGAAMGTPTVGIFGPESPSRWAPAGSRSIAVQARGVECSPCANTYRLQDPRDCANHDRLKCLREVSVEIVLDALRQLLGLRSDYLGSPKARDLN